MRRIALTRWFRVTVPLLLGAAIASSSAMAGERVEPRPSGYDVRIMDLDGNRRLDAAEYRAAFGRLFADWDPDGDGRVPPAAFPPQATAGEPLETALGRKGNFDRHDLDGDGVLTLKEFLVQADRRHAESRRLAARRATGER